MTTAFESVQWAQTIVPTAKIMNQFFPYFIETGGMHCFAIIVSFPFPAPYTTINYFYNSHPLIFKYLKQTELRSEFEIILKRRLFIFTLVSSITSVVKKYESHFICWEQHILDDNSLADMKQLACVFWLQKKRQFNIKTSAHQGVNKNCKKRKKKTNHNKLNMPCNHYPSLLVNEPNRKRLQTNDTSICIVTNVLLVAII